MAEKEIIKTGNTSNEKKITFERTFNPLRPFHSVKMHYISYKEARKQFRKLKMQLADVREKKSALIADRSIEYTIVNGQVHLATDVSVPSVIETLKVFDSKIVCAYPIESAILFNRQICINAVCINVTNLTLFDDIGKTGKKAKASGLKAIVALLFSGYVDYVCAKALELSNVPIIGKAITYFVAAAVTIEATAYAISNLLQYNILRTQIKMQEPLEQVHEEITNFNLFLLRQLEGE